MPCRARDFSFVFVLSGDLRDFGLEFRFNVARINLQDLLTQRHPALGLHIMPLSPAGPVPGSYGMRQFLFLPVLGMVGDLFFLDAFNFNNVFF